MQLIKKAPKSIYKLSLNFMEGDADGWHEGIIFSLNKDSLEILGLIDLYSKQLERSRKGCSGQDTVELFKKAIEIVLADPRLRTVAVQNEKHAEYQASDYLLELGHSPYNGYDDIYRTISSITLSWYDELGDEYLIQRY